MAMSHVEFCKILKEKFNIKIFKGIGLETEADIAKARKYIKNGRLDYF